VYDEVGFDKIALTLIPQFQQQIYSFLMSWHSTRVSSKMLLCSLWGEWGDSKWERG